MSGHLTHLDTRFDAGLSFLRVWWAWRNGPQRSGLLHCVGLAAHAPSAQQILSLGAQSAVAGPDATTSPTRSDGGVGAQALTSLAQELATACWGLLPGVHRIALQGGAVLLTLAVGDPWPALRHLSVQTDFLELKQPDASVEWSYEAIELIAKRCRRGAQVLIEKPSPTLEGMLRKAGFELPSDGTAPHTKARYDPHWRLPADRAPPTQPGHAIVVGAGLSGAAVAQSLARRGWRVTVLDAAAEPAQGASSLPVGLLVPHVSPDDALISRATRAGVRMTLQAAEQLLQHGQDWTLTGALFSQHSRARRLPAAWASGEEAHAAEWARARADSVWHPRAGWVKPQALVRSWLAHPGIAFSGGSLVAGVERRGADWAVLDASGRALAQAPLVVLCTAYATRTLLPDAALGAMDCVAGQVVSGTWLREWTDDAPLGKAMPAPAPALAPVSGEGHFIPAVAGHAEPARTHEARATPFWLSGSTYERAPLASLDAAHAIRSTAQRIEQLSATLPAHIAAGLQTQLAAGQVNTWRGERCTTVDRLPTVGPAYAGDTSLQVCIGMGSRGLTFAALCAELLAAQLHGEPWPLERRIALALNSARWQNRSPQQSNEKAKHHAP